VARDGGFDAQPVGRGVIPVALDRFGQRRKKLLDVRHTAVDGRLNPGGANRQ
jgi:hypothetical protein